MNDPWVHGVADHFAQRIVTSNASDEERVAQVYAILFAPRTTRRLKPSNVWIIFISTEIACEIAPVQKTQVEIAQVPVRRIGKRGAVWPECCIRVTSFSTSIK